MEKNLELAMEYLKENNFLSPHLHTNDLQTFTSHINGQEQDLYLYFNFISVQLFKIYDSSSVNSSVTQSGCDYCIHFADKESDS